MEMEEREESDDGSFITTGFNIITHQLNEVVDQGARGLSGTREPRMNGRSGWSSLSVISRRYCRVLLYSSCT